MKSSKNSMFMRRVKGLKKKTFELGTLCGVDAVLICYGESGSDEQNIPHTWPENPDEVRRILKSYKDHCQQENNGRKRRQQPLAEDTQTEKRRKLADKDILNGYSSDQLQELLKVVNAKLEKVNHLLAEKRDQKLHLCTEQICDQRSVPDSRTEPRIDLASPVPMPSDSMRFVLDPFLPELQQEKQDQCGLSSEGLENGNCPSTMLGYSVPFPQMNGMGPSIPLHCSDDSMAFFDDPSFPNMTSDSMRFVRDPFLPELQQEKQDQCGLSSEGLENGNCPSTMLGYSVPFPQMNGMGPSIPLHCSDDSMDFFDDPSLPNMTSDSMRFVRDPFLPELQQEKQDQCGLSSSEMESMMIFLKGIEYGNCASTMLGYSVPFPRMNGMGPSIPLYCSDNSMDFFDDPSLQNIPSDSMRFVLNPFLPKLQQEKQHQCGLSSSEMESMMIFLRGLENGNCHRTMLGNSVPFPRMNGMGPSIPLHCSYDSMDFFEYPSLPNLQ